VGLSTEQAFLAALGQRIREIRQSRGYSQEALALKAGIDRTYVSSLERGKRNVSALNVRRLAKALGVRPRDLWDF
jgi:transcriptional regulator with XRE-family HTH domain